MTDSLRLVRSLITEWRDEATLFRRRGQHALAECAESFANELEERLREWMLEALTLEEAAGESGLAYDTLQRRVASGEVPNAGRKGAPRVRRCDLWPALRRPRLVTGEPDLAAEELAARDVLR
ncbi:MAG: hypothetical protein ACE5JG_10280 [Planctomycetota bacterium]